jgi:hypothetical protein
MTLIDCPREADVLDALASARWPNRVDRELSDHVASCAICTDVLTVAAAMQHDHDAAWKEASVPSSGQMWWRVEMRARQDAIREASRPVTVAQGAAGLFALALAGAGGWFAWPAARYYLSSFSGTSLAQMPAFTSPLTIPLVVALGALLVVAPLALYVVLSDE